MAVRAHKPLKDDLSTIWDILKSLAFFLGIYLFFAGWLYLYYYFMKFSIYYTQMKFEVTSVYNYGFLSLIDKTMSTTFFAFIIILFVVYYYRQHLRYAYAFIFSLIIIFFFLTYYIIENKAERDAQNILDKKFENHLPAAIYFDFKEEFLKSLSTDTTESRLLPPPDANAGLVRTFQKGNVKGGIEMLHYNENLALYLFFETEDSYYVIYNNRIAGAKKGSGQVDVKLYCIYKKDLNYAGRYIIY